MLRAKKVKDSGGEAKPASGLPLIITTDRPLRDITADGLSALIAANNPPHIFQRGTTLVRLRFDDHGAPFIETMSDAALRGRLARIADWQKEDPPEEVPPPMDMVRDLYALPEWPLPILNGIVESPVFGPDGTLVTMPGYNPAARLWFHLRPGFKLPEVSASPSRAELARAKALLLDELLGEFPFVDDAGRAHALAALLLPFVRPMVVGPTPLHLVDKPTPGSGASLMMDVIAIVATGRTADVMTQSEYEEEWRKRITAVLLRGPVYVLIDNLRRTLDSAAVSAAITATIWTDRILGHSRTASVPVTCCWSATGNNVRMSNEISRRAILVRLDPKIDQPWLRSDFRHPDLRRWAREHRGELVWAALTLGQGYVAAGCPRPHVVELGNFEAWTRVVGGILEVAKVPGFLANVADMYARSDEEGRMWRAFVAAWWERQRAEPVQVGELYQLATDADLLAPVLGEKSERSQRSSLGRALMRMRDRVIGSHRVEVLDPDHRGVQRYRLVPVGSGQPDQGADLPTSSEKSAEKSAGQNDSGTSTSGHSADFADFSATTPDRGSDAENTAPHGVAHVANPGGEVPEAALTTTGVKGEKSAKSAPRPQSLLAEGLEPADLGADFSGEVGRKSAAPPTAGNGDDLNEVTI